MEYITIFNGDKVEKSFFEQRLKELLTEKWSLKKISELTTNHIDCDLTFATISPETATHYYESDNNSCITVEAYKHYINNKK